MSKIDPSVIVLNRDGAEPVLLRSGPTDTEARNFAIEHNRRHGAGEPGGFNQISATRQDIVPAQFITTAHRFADEEAYLADPHGGEEIDLVEAGDDEPGDEEE